MQSTPSICMGNDDLASGGDVVQRVNGVAVNVNEYG